MTGIFRILPAWQKGEDILSRVYELLYFLLTIRNKEKSLTCSFEIVRCS